MAGMFARLTIFRYSSNSFKRNRHGIVLISNGFCPAEPDFSEKRNEIQTENILPTSRNGQADTVSTTMVNVPLTTVLPESRVIHETAIVHPDAFIGEVSFHLVVAVGFLGLRMFFLNNAIASKYSELNILTMSPCRVL